MLASALKTWDIHLGEDKSSERIFHIQEGALLLGASRDCAMVSTADGVAQRHVEFLVKVGTLLLRVLEGAPPVRVNGVSVDGLGHVPCPASIEIGSLRVSVKEATAKAALRPESESTLRTVDPTGASACQLADTASPNLPEAALVQETVARTAPQVLQTPASICPESTMAFSMEPSEPSVSAKVPVRIDYTVKDEIARGGMGKIYAAEDSELDRLVALKVSTVGDRSKDSQFFEEAKVLATLAHPNIVPIHNLGVDAEGRPFYSMKLIQGRTLQWIIKQLAAGDHGTESVYPCERLLEIFRKVCDAMSFAHSKGYLHRDLKPDNIMVGEFGEVLVMDWGLAKVIRKHRPGSDPVAGAEPETLSYVEGTPQYMSPEQANGVYGGLDERSDIYSLGGILYAILNYRPPVSGSSVDEVLQKVRKKQTPKVPMRGGSEDELPQLRMRPAVPEALRAVTLKALSHQPTDRYQSVSALIKEVEAYQNGFATIAETAGIWRHLVLLVRRHRIASGFAAAMLVGAAIFTLRLSASEKRANDNARLAKQESDSAAASATFANEQFAIATANEQQARASEQRAILNERKAKEEKAHAQIALAEAAEQNLNASAIRSALVAVDEDFRNQPWRYLDRAGNSAEWTSEIASSEYHELIPIPKKSGSMLALHKKGSIEVLDLTSGLAEETCRIADGGAMAFTHGMALSSDAETAAVATLEQYKDQPEAPTFQVHLVNLLDGARRPLEATPFTNRFNQIHLAFSPDGKLLLVLYGSGIAHSSQAMMFDAITGAALWRKSEAWFDFYHFQETGKCRCFKHSRQQAQLDPRTGSEISAGAEGVRIPVAETSPISDGHSSGVLFFHRGIIRNIDGNEGQTFFEIRLPTPEARGTQLSYLDDGKLFASLSPVSENSSVLQIWEGSKGEMGRLLKSSPIAILDHSKLVTHPSWKHVAILDGSRAKARARVWSIHSVQDECLQMDDGVSRGFSFLAPPEKLIYQTKFDQLTRKAQAMFFKQSEKKGRATRLLEGIERPFSCFSSSKSGEILAFGFAAQINAPTSLRLFRNASLGQFQDISNAPVIPISGIPECFELNSDGSVIWLGNGFYEAPTGKLITSLDRSELEGLEKGSSACWVGNTHVAELVVKKMQGSERLRKIVLWSCQAGERAEETAASATALASSPDGKHIAEARFDMRVCIRDAATLKEERVLRVHDAPVTGLAWHPTLPLLATASEDFTVKIWNLETESLEEEIGLFLGVPGKLYWSPDGKTLAVRTTSGRAGINLFTPRASNHPSK